MEYNNFRCFGFLEFKDPASLTKVIESGPHTIDGKQVCCVCVVLCACASCTCYLYLQQYLLSCWVKIQDAIY